MLLRKPFRAQRASKRFHSTVKSVVQNHVGSVGESFLAAGLRAFVRLFPTMRSTAENKVFFMFGGTAKVFTNKLIGWLTDSVASAASFSKIAFRSHCKRVA